MEILVTGGAGYIGSIVVEELLKQDYSVVVIDNLQEGHKEAVLPEAIFYEGDFGNRNLLNEIFNNHKIDAVLHFAAETTIEFSMTDPGRYFRNNLVMRSVEEVGKWRQAESMSIRCFVCCHGNSKAGILYSRQF